MHIMIGIGFALMLCSAAQSEADEVLVGAQFPLSGPMASYSGPFLKAGAEIALQRINEAKLLGNDRTLKLLIEDNAGDRNQAISLMNQFASSDNVIAVLGVYGSFLSLPVAPVANEVKTPLLAIAVSPVIVQAGPWSFTLLEPPEISMAALGDLAVDHLKVHDVALIHDRANDASVRLRDAFAKIMTAHGVNIVSDDGITAQDTNFAPLATKLVSEKIDALFVESVPSVAGNFLVQVRQAGLSPDVRILAMRSSASRSASSWKRRRSCSSAAPIFR